MEHLHLQLLLTLAAAAVFFLQPVLAQMGQNNNSADPILAVDFPDPSLVSIDKSFIAFATSGNGYNVQIAVSFDSAFQDWRLWEGADPLPDPGTWSVNDRNIWAPDVFQLNDGRWIMYYSATVSSAPDKHCVGSAIALNPFGPYTSNSEPLVCPLEQGGAIDPAAFMDPKSGKLYVLYKVDGNSLNQGTGPCRFNKDDESFPLNPTPIMLQEVGPDDGTTLIGDPVKLLDRDDLDGPLVEAPSLYYSEVADIYFLTYSSNCYSTELYDVGLASSTDLCQEFIKSATPLMTSSTGPVFAPGGADISIDGTFALFHGTVDVRDNGEPIRHLFATLLEQSGSDMIAVLP